MADLQGYTQLLLICALSTILLGSILIRKKQNKKPHHLPPGPPSLPIIGHLHLLSQTPHRDFYNISTRYGPIIHLYLGSVPCIVASTAEAAREFLRTHEITFSNRPAQTVVVESLTYGFQDFLFAPYGPYWKFMKNLCMSELLGGRMLNQLFHIRQQENKRFIKVLLKKGMAGEAVDVGRQLMTLSNNIISRMAMSRTSRFCEGEEEEDEEEVRKLVSDIAELTGTLNVSDLFGFLKSLDLQGFNKKLKRIQVKTDALMDRVIEEHREERRKSKEVGGAHQARDILDVLLDVHEDETSEIKLTLENIKAFIMNVLVGGTDATAGTMDWAMAELINNPRMMEKARQEIDAVIGKNRIVNESDVVNLPYVQAIVKETLRLHPLAPLIPRESSERATVGGYDIPAKTQLFINLWAIGRDPNHWESPLEYRPERFTGEERNNGLSQLDFRGQHFEFIPFGSGRRMCPGTSLALQIMHVNLATMIQCFEWELVNGVNGSLIDMEERPGLTVPRAHPIICVPVPRLDPFPSI